MSCLDNAIILYLLILLIMIYAKPNLIFEEDYTQKKINNNVNITYFQIILFILSICCYLLCCLVNVF